MNGARSIPDIFVDLFKQLTTLVRTEAQLARVEASEKMAQVAGGLGLVVGGSVLVIGLILLFVGVSRLKAKGLVPDKTIQQLQRDALMARNQMRNNDDGVKRAA